MTNRRDPPPTDEGWYALHDFRKIDWDAWRSAPEETRRRALDEVVDFLDSRLALADADDGASALYSILGHESDFFVLHLRPTTAHLGALERQFDLTEFAGFTERTSSFVSVTEASGYSEEARGYFEDDGEVNPGLANYIKTRLEPSIPDATHVCFYPMNKRRDGEQNWYDLPFEDRAEYMHAHGEIGRQYGGRVTQMITGAIAMDDWEWGVTLWGDDLVDMKQLLYEMRFDPSTSLFAEFGPFSIGRRMSPSDLPTFLAGGAVPSDDDTIPERLRQIETSGPTVSEPRRGDGEAVPATDRGLEAGAISETDAVESASESSGTDLESESVESDDMVTRLGTFGLYEGTDYEAGGYAVLLYSNADAQELAANVDDLRGHFETYDSHEMTVVRASGGKSAVASLWETERAAGIAEGFLAELPGVTRSLTGPLDGAGESTARDHTASDSIDIREELAEMDIYAGTPHGEDIFALVLYSSAPIEELTASVDDLNSGFDRYDTHLGTSTYSHPHDGPAAVVSLWETQDAADTASEYLLELPAVVGWADDGEGFSTMGMFYTVKPEHREEFVEKFETVGEVLDGREGHRESALMVNTDDENDMFIASQWDSKEDAMEFFRSDAFSQTVDWGRDILADKPRHVFLA